jgi:hypothetical protein
MVAALAEDRSLLASANRSSPGLHSGPPSGWATELGVASSTVVSAPARSTVGNVGTRASLTRSCQRRQHSSATALVRAVTR